MEKANFGQIVSFLFGIANDCLVDVYDVGDYRKIILPMMVIRRFDAVLEPTKKAVLEMKKNLDAAGITEQDEALCNTAGEAFCNSSPYTLSDLKSRTNQQQLRADFILYLDGFSKNVQDIIKKFEFRNQIDKLSEHDILGLLISKFTDPSINLSSRPVTTASGTVLPALDNHTMGTVFEEVIRKFNEETNVTDAGRHFTPRDIVELITVADSGVLAPALARPKDGGGYELISGHRRLAACRALGMETMPVIIRNLTDEEAVITMVDSNLQRNQTYSGEHRKRA